MCYLCCKQTFSTQQFVNVHKTVSLTSRLTATWLRGDISCAPDPATTSSFSSDNIWCRSVLAVWRGEVVAVGNNVAEMPVAAGVAELAAI
jgi:hypothetical protein